MPKGYITYSKYAVHDTHCTLATFLTCASKHLFTTVFVAQRGVLGR